MKLHECATMTTTFRMRLSCQICVAFILAATAGQGFADDMTASKLFGSVATGSKHQPIVVGSYAQGCIGGAVELPETGPTWQAMRLERNRNWGHPELIDYIVKLSGKAAELGWKGLYVGDMAQPRGGPMKTGHSSHQIGLDVDIWMLPPDRLDLSREEREEISSISVRTEDQTSINENWTDTHFEVLRAAAKDPRVDRIFIAPAIKVELCKQAGEDRLWLQRMRPWHQHNYHFHVRLKCPSGELYCMPQRPTVEELSKGGDGCDSSLEWWVTDYLESLKKPQEEKPPSAVRSARNYLMTDLPQACGEILTSD